MKKNLDKIFLILYIIATIIGVLLGIFVIIKKDKRIIDIESRIEELENQSKEVHEYILNRIGG